MGRIGPRVKTPHKLTGREQQVLELVRVGLTNEEIAERLGISANGVKYHVSEILSKLGVGTREEAARWEPEGERRGWWRALAPLTLAKAAGVALAAVVLVGLGVLAWGVLKEEGGGSGAEGDGSGPLVSVASPTANPISGVALPTVAPEPAPGQHFIEGWTIFATDRDGMEAWRIAEGYNPEWAPDGDLIAYVGASNSADLSGTSYVHAKSLSTGEVYEAGWFYWSDDGLFWQCADFGPGRWSHEGDRFAIWAGYDRKSDIVNFDTGDRFRGSGCYTEWLQDGRSIFVEQCDEWNEPFCIHIREGASLSELTAGSRPRVSPDGSMLAFYRDASLWLHDFDSGEETKLAEVVLEGPDQPDWSPDGRSIVFTSDTIQVIDIETGAVRDIGQGVFPRWSPDGSRIAYYEIDREGQECHGVISVVDSDTGELMFSIPNVRYGFSWSPDGQRLAYAASDTELPSECPVQWRPVRTDCAVCSAGPARVIPPASQ